MNCWGTVKRSSQKTESFKDQMPVLCRGDGCGLALGGDAARYMTRFKGCLHRLNLTSWVRFLKKRWLGICCYAHLFSYNLFVIMPPHNTSAVLKYFTATFMSSLFVF